MKNTIMVIMGVSGCGKSTIGEKLSEITGIPFYDGDDFHPVENVEKMKSGVPLNSSDRFPWLQILALKIKEWKNKDGAILACSALKEKYRTILASKHDAIVWIFLSGNQQLIQSRIEKRQGHFMKSDLLTSQFHDLEVPEYGIHIDISQSPDNIIAEIISKLKTHE